MLAHFSIWPIHGQIVDVTTAQTINQTLEGLDVQYEVGSMGTVIKGDWEQVMAAILACHQAVVSSHARVLTNISIDDQRDSEVSSDEAVCQAQMVQDSTSQ